MQLTTRVKRWSSDLDWDFLLARECRQYSGGRASFEGHTHIQMWDGCWRSTLKMSSSIWSSMGFFSLLFSFLSPSFFFSKEQDLHQHHIRFTWNSWILAFLGFRLPLLSVQQSQQWLNLDDHTEYCNPAQVWNPQAFHCGFRPDIVQSLPN